MALQMGLPRFLQHAVGILPCLGVICRLFLNYWSGCGGAGEEERLKKWSNRVEIDCVAGWSVNTPYHIFRCKCAGLVYLHLF